MPQILCSSTNPWQTHLQVVATRIRRAIARVSVIICALNRVDLKRAQQDPQIDEESAVRVTLPRAITLSAVLILPVACGTSDERPPAEVKSTVSAASTSPAPAKAELTKVNFASRVLAALKAKSTFQVDTFLLGKGSWDDDDKVTTTVRMKGAVTDLAVVDGANQLVRIGDSVYVQDAELTGGTKGPWAKVNPKGKTAGARAVAQSADILLSRALAYQMVAATAYATGFKPGGQFSIDRVDSLEYLFTIDLNKAVAGNALRGFLDRSDLKRTSPSLSVSIAVDDKDLPRRIEFVLADKDGGATSFRLTISRFGQRVTIAAPPAGKLAKVR
jgi:hypothetical protein